AGPGPTPGDRALYPDPDYDTPAGAAFGDRMWPAVSFHTPKAFRDPSACAASRFKISPPDCRLRDRDRARRHHRQQLDCEHPGQELDCRMGLRGALGAFTYGV